MGVGVICFIVYSDFVLAILFPLYLRLCILSWLNTRRLRETEFTLARSSRVRQ